jgi:hypothetical protein
MIEEFENDKPNIENEKNDIEKEKRRKLKEEKRQTKKYRESLKEYILTGRFNNETWKENQDFCKKRNIKAIYGTPQKIAKDIPFESTLYLLEMNNDINQIMGIGMIVNHPQYHKYTIHENQNFNRFSYIGKNRISRSEMTESEEEILKVFDILCFKGKKHMKRGANLKLFSPIMLYRCCKKIDLIKFIKEMFLLRFSP